MDPSNMLMHFLNKSFAIEVTQSLGHTEPTPTVPDNLQNLLSCLPLVMIVCLA